MSVQVTCPSCSRRYSQPKKALGRRVRCLQCNFEFLIRDAVQHSAMPVEEPPKHTNDANRFSSILVLTFAWGSLVAISISFLIYWFAYRDTWDIDHYSAICERCEVVHDAIARSDDDAASIAYEELYLFIEGHKIQNHDLKGRINSAIAAYSPVWERREEHRKETEARLLAESKKENADIEHERNQHQDRESQVSGIRQKVKFYRDSKGALISEAEAETRLSELRTKILLMPDNAEKAYYKGFLKSLESEWTRIKAQGPVEEK